MDLSLTQEHEMVAKMVRDFAEKEVAPVIKEYDREQKHIPWVFKRLGELGVLGICLPVKLGGAGMDCISLGLACEELEHVDTSLRVILSVHVGLNSLALFQGGSEEQKEKYLTPQATGEKIATYALTEPGAGFDAAGIRTTARRRGDTYISSMAKRCGSAWRTWLINSSSSPRLSRKNATRACRPSSSSEAFPA
jgi:glutaryl-CoA dehydrogenase (non-decarboxylating)